MQDRCSVEFGIVDLSSLPGGRLDDVIGIFNRADYEMAFGNAEVDSVTAAAALTDHFTNQVTLGRARVSGIPNQQPVVCYYYNVSQERLVRDLAGEKMLRDNVGEVGVYYWCISAVDDEGNLTPLSDPIEVSVE